MIINIPEILARIDEVADPLEKIRQVGGALSEVKNLTAELSRVRRDEVERLIAGKIMSQNEIARQVGLTSARMSQLLTSGPAPERAFFGVGVKTVIVAVAQKMEAEKAKPGPVVSVDDMWAYDNLRVLVEDLGFDSAYEVIPPPGNVRLNRDGLVIVCGPRHSSLISQILESDDKLAFEKDSSGWYLVDRVTGTAYRSAEDSGGNGDTAYLGRLPRPDGKGTFLYIAGIHAAGAAGVVHYLQNELPNLYREVRHRRFSTLISCQYDPNSRKVIDSERITPIYRHEA
ncbi:sigma-70 family RNA polymerase sigma factor [Streptosporangium sp. NPDC051023]|uniref:sigma-70 family RNA polymerase sigma factor n=1 Tax=Streptosporangium sp. NPDC051023 TaxID=3155410 RepID=UPI0034509BD8